MDRGRGGAAAPPAPAPVHPDPLALLGVLLTACGFIGGVLSRRARLEQHDRGAPSSTRPPARFAALRGGASGAGGAAAGAPRDRARAASPGPTAGTVAYLAGSTLYVTNSEGNTIKVSTSAGTTVTKTVTATVKDIHPGETVTSPAPAGSDGAVSAESISVGANAGGLAGLFGGAALEQLRQHRGRWSSGLFGGCSTERASAQPISTTQHRS